MNQGSRNVGQKSVIEKLMNGLEFILAETEPVVARNSASAGELRQMAEYLAQIRLVLADLTRLSKAGGGEDAVLEDLLARFTNVEGRIKEMRNDRQAARP